MTAPAERITRSWLARVQEQAVRMGRDIHDDPLSGHETELLARWCTRGVAPYTAACWLCGRAGGVA